MTLSSSLKKFVVLLALLSVSLPLSFMATMGPAFADGIVFDGNIGGGSGAGGSDIPKQDPVRNEPAPGGSKAKPGGGKSNTYILSRKAEGPLDPRIRVRMQTKKVVSGIVSVGGTVSAPSNHSFFRNVNVACGPSTQTREVVGAKVTIQTTKITEFYENNPSKTLSQSNYTPKILSIQCLAIDFSVRQVKCYVSATGTINKVAPTRAHVTTKTSRTAYGNGNKSYSGCLNSRSVVVNVSSVLSSYGRWHLTAKFNVETIKVRVPLTVNPITGKARPVEIVSRSGVRTAATLNNYAQITCRGAQMSSNRSAAWTGSPKYTHAECGPESSKPVYQCTGVNDLPSINGQATRSATLFRDGEENSLRLPNVGISGKGVKVHSTQTQVLRSGTPWNTNGSVNARTNDVQLKANGSSKFSSNKGTPWMSGKLRDFTVSSVWSSDKDAPTKLTPSTTSDISLTIPTIRINGWKVSDSENQVYYTRGTTSIRSTAVCKMTPITLDFVRAKESG